MFCAGRQIGAGAEGAAGAGHDDDAHVVIGVGLVEGGDHLVHHLACEGVELFRPVEGDGLDMVCDLDANLFVFAHRASSGASSFW